MGRACSPSPHVRSPGRSENDCSHAVPRLAGADSLRSSVPPGRAVRIDPSGETVTSSDSLRITHGPSARRTSRGWAWISGTGPDSTPTVASTTMAYGTGASPGAHDTRTTSPARKVTSALARSKWNTAEPGPGVPHLDALEATGRHGGGVPRLTRPGAGPLQLTARRFRQDQPNGGQAEVVHDVRRDPGLGDGAAHRGSGSGHEGRGYVPGPSPGTVPVPAPRRCVPDVPRTAGRRPSCGRVVTVIMQVPALSSRRHTEPRRAAPGPVPGPALGARRPVRMIPHTLSVDGRRLRYAMSNNAAAHGPEGPGARRCGP